MDLEVSGKYFTFTFVLQVAWKLYLYVWFCLLFVVLDILPPGLYIRFFYKTAKANIHIHYRHYFFYGTFNSLPDFFIYESISLQRGCPLILTWELNRGIFGFFSMYCIQHCFICRPPQIPLCRRTLGSNPGMLQLRDWQSDALITRLNLIITWELRAYNNCCVQEELMTMDQKKLRLQTSMRMLKDEPVPEGYMRYRSVSSRLSCYFLTAQCEGSRTSLSLRDTWDTGQWVLVCHVRSSLPRAKAQGRARPWGIHEIQVSEFSSLLWVRPCSVRMLKRTSPSLRDTWDTGQWVLVCHVTPSLLTVHAQGRACKRLVDFWRHYCVVSTQAQRYEKKDQWAKERKTYFKNIGKTIRKQEKREDEMGIDREWGRSRIRRKKIPFYVLYICYEK
jgi:hypothetical protein